MHTAVTPEWESLRGMWLACKKGQQCIDKEPVLNSQPSL